MSPFDPKMPPTAQTLTTDGGVTVIVKPVTLGETPPPEPKRGPEARESSPRVVIRVPERPAREGKRDAFVRMLDAEHGKFLLATCRAQGNVKPESTKDMAQRVLLTAAEQFVKHDFDKHGPPRNLRGWLARLVQNDASNHRRVRKPDVKEGADAEAVACPMPDPERTAELNERKARFARHVDGLSKGEQDAVLCCDVYEMTIEQAAAALDLPWGTVAARLARGRGKLVESIRESERATAAGERRK